MMKALYLLLLVSGSALADDAAIVNCRSISAAAARLACYDAIQVRTATTGAFAAPVASQAAAAVPARSAAQDFGLEQKKQQETKSVESTIVGTFSGWGPGAQIELANGQVWRVIDGSEAVLTPKANTKAKVERNYFGTLFLVVEGTNHSPKVRRVK